MTVLAIKTKAVLATLILAGLVGFTSGCSTSQVDIGYSPGSPASSINDEAATFGLGQFADQRGQEPHWIGEVRGKYHYPKSIIETNRPVAQVVREIIKKGAEDRDMLRSGDGSRRYQLYGQVLRLDGIETEATVVRAHLVSRLIDLENNRQIHAADHKAERVVPLDTGNSADLESLIEEALNEVVAASLDDPKLREALLAAGEDS